MLIEGESLLNDGTAVVLFGVIFTLATGAEVTVAGAALDFVRTCGLGILVGAAIGYGGSRVIHLIDDPMIEITVTVVLAWGSFALAEQIHSSGVLATVTAGLICGNHAARTGMSPTTKIATFTFWAYVAFALNSIVFLLIGLEVQLGGLLASWRTVLLAWFVTTAARAIVIGTVTALLRRSRERLPRGWATVMIWGGIRGGLSMVLVLALPSDFPHRQFLINVVFGVVVLTILFQGTTMAVLLKWLGIVSAQAQGRKYQRARTESLAARAALDELEVLARTQTPDPSVLAELRAQYLERAAEADGQVRALHVSDAILARAERHRVERHLILVEKERVFKALQDGLASEEVAADLIAELDARLVQLDDLFLSDPEASPAPAPVAPPPSAAPTEAEARDPAATAPADDEPVER